MSSHSNDNPQSHSPKKDYDHVVHNFDAMNKAIDGQVDKQFELSEIYRFENTSRRTLILMHVTISLCVLTLTAAVLWWLFGSKSLPDIDSLRIINSTDNSGVLETIASGQQIAEAERPFINTSFTVFHRTVTPSGEIVVTGKNYQPVDLLKPVEQYCYLEKNNTQGMSGMPLASMNQGRLSIETEDEKLKQYIQRYCQF